MSSSDTQASLFNADDVKGVVRQHHRVKVIVHSHIRTSPPIGSNRPGVIDCSKDTISLNTSKSIKSIGSANLTLVPRSNYLNYIFPNDWINIWVDPGDGRGFIRIFFGFVDRIERSINTDSNGATTTMFELSCSDFTKAFEASHIYFNPHIADRKDFIGNFAGTKNLGGAQLRAKGVTAFGTPADCVLTFAHLLHGFGAQFVSPPEYPFNKSLLENSRKFRRAWAKSRLPKEILENIGTTTITNWIDRLVIDASPIIEVLESGKIDDDTNAKLDRLFSKSEKQNFIDQFSTNEGASDKIKERFAIAIRLSQLGFDPNSSADITTGASVDATTLGPGHLLDLIDFTFVEHLAIDGSIVSAPIWTQQGSVWSLMNAYSNNIVNELFMDLRPLGKLDSEFQFVDGGYVRSADEHHNPDIHDYGVRFVPALIMREYPFSTVQAIKTEGAQVLGKPVGLVTFGAVFCLQPNVPGRRVASLKTLNDYLYEKNPSLNATKHLDVAVISVQDIISENIGRSDSDVVNLLEVYSDGFMGNHMKFTTQDVQPLSIPISVARHGLRVRTYNTRFARFSKKHSTQQGVDSSGTRRKIVRWALMLDHWYQHNIEYLNGTMTTRSFPEIRVGFRLDVAERNESYYVESVSHTWSYPDGMKTSFQLSRGQRNDPFPVYELPALPAFHGDRKAVSRLADIFRQKDPSAVLRAVVGHPTQKSDGDPSQRNLTDVASDRPWGKKVDSYRNADSFSAEAGLLNEIYSSLESVGQLFDAEQARQEMERALGTSAEKLAGLRIGSRTNVLKAQTGSKTSLKGFRGSGVKK